MNTLFANIEFTKPFFLWLLLALPLLWFRYRDRRLLVLISRTVILALVIFTLADPQSTSEQARTQEERIFAFDFSASIAPGMRRWMKDAMGQLPAPNRNDRVFVFGSAEDQSRESFELRVSSTPRAEKSLFVYRRLGNPGQRRTSDAGACSRRHQSLRS